MPFYNRVTAALLQSPLRRILAGSTNLVRYHGRRSGRVFTTPTQYVRHGDGVVVFVGNPWQKTWWRNFEETRELELLLDGEWVTMLGHAYVGSDEPEVVRPLLQAYLERFPRASKAMTGTTEGERVRNAVVVSCRRPTSPVTGSATSASKEA